MDISKPNMMNGVKTKIKRNGIALIIGTINY